MPTQDKPWDWGRLSISPNFLCDYQDMIDAYTKHPMTRRIHKAFREANCNPSFSMCRQRLYGEFKEISSNDIKCNDIQQTRYKS